MACTIEGAERLRWSVPEWIARNAIFFLVRELEKSEETRVLARRLTAASEQRESFISITDFFRAPESKRIWNDAIDRADRMIALEDPHDWNEPDAYEPFRASFNKLRLIAPS